MGSETSGGERLIPEPSFTWLNPPQPGELPRSPRRYFEGYSQAEWAEAMSGSNDARCR